MYILGLDRRIEMSESLVQNRQEFTFFKIDGYENVLNGVGLKKYDPKLATKYRASDRLTDIENGEIWRHNGMGKRIIKLPIQDAFREGYKVTEDDDDEIVKWIVKKNLWKKFKTCARWADVFGGCVIVLGIKDGGDLEDEVDENKIDDISFAHVFDKSQVNVYNLDTDVDSANFGEPETYDISPINGGDSFRVHHSRIIRIDGEKLTEREFQRNNYWHDSVYQAIYKEVERASTGQVSVSRALDELYIYIMKMRGLAQQVAQGNEAKVVKRLNQVDLTRNSLNMIGIDENEEIIRNSITLTGVSDALNLLYQAVSIVTGIPQSLLTGTAPRGLSNSDESGMTFYYDKVANKQEEQLTEPLAKLVRYSMLAKGGPTKGRVIDGWDIVWNPIERLSEKEIVENRKSQAEVDKIYTVDIGALNPAEIRESRFGGIEESFNTTIKTEYNQPTAQDLANAAAEIDTNE